VHSSCFRHPARHKFLLAVALGLALAVPLAAQSSRQQPVDTQRILRADDQPGNWLTHGRTYSEQRFSPLTAIRKDNVGRLGLAWSYELKSSRGAEATPLIVDGVMYTSSAWSIVHAIDAATGRELWVYDPAVDRSVGAKACCDTVNRGVAFYAGKVFVGVLDGRLEAIDSGTGKRVWSTVTVDQSNAYTITGAPRAANGLVYIGNSGAEYGVRGYISAYDVESGALRWRFYTVPGNPAKGPDGAASDSVMAMAAATWTGEWWQMGAGGTVWDAIVYDADFDQLIIGVGNGSPWNHRVRSPGGGDNLFLASIVAVDAKTGKYRWHYQTTPAETWDYTATQPIILAELTIDGRRRKVAMQAPKNGFFYVVDRTNGKLISAKPFIHMAKTADTPKGAPISWAYAVDPVTGRPLENPEARYADTLVTIHPSAGGAHNWHPMSYSPQTGLVYLPMQDGAVTLGAESPFVHRAGVWNLGIARVPFTDDLKARQLMKNSAIAALVAWDPVAQKAAWRIERRSAWNGGTLATAGGLVFQGLIDGRFLALDAATGKELWSFDNQAATLAGPVSYEVNGEQYVAVLAGYGSVFYLAFGFGAPKEGGPINARVYAFKIGGNAPPPVIELQRIPTAKPPEIVATPEEYRRGSEIYTGLCQMCHGRGVVTGGVLPDLRKSPRLQDREAWRRAVVEGDFSPRGMPVFRNLITADDAEAIRAYVARQAQFLYDEEQMPKAAGN
jgi:quinohemoprotein ethanol dehydrogenase